MHNERTELLTLHGDTKCDAADGSLLLSDLNQAFTLSDRSLHGFSVTTQGMERIASSYKLGSILYRKDFGAYFNIVL